MTSPRQNIWVCYSPLGEKLETTRANFLDLTRLTGWYEHPPHPNTVEENRRKLADGEPLGPTLANDEPEEPGETDAEREAREAEEAERAAENERLLAEAARIAEEERQDREAAGDDEGENEEEQTDEGRKLLTLAADFADMEKPAIFAYIEETFPGNSVDGRLGRDKLVEKAIELAQAELSA